jgi:hypothetical protein
LSAVSKQIEDYTRRSFNQTTSTIRYFTALNQDECIVDDLVTLTTLQTDDYANRTYAVTWSATDYDLWPYNAAGHSEPYTMLERNVFTGLYVFPCAERGVKVTGVWGWPAVPTPVTEACLLQAARIFKRRDAPFGVIGNSEIGTLRTIPAMDADVKALLQQYVAWSPT